MKIKQYGSTEESLEDMRSANQDSPLPFLYSRSSERVYIGSNHVDMAEKTVEEALDVRFFGESCEIRIFWEEGERKAVKIAEGDDQRFIDVTVPLAGSFYDQEPEKWTSITKRMILEYDEDGQAQVAYTRLLRLK